MRFLLFSFLIILSLQKICAQEYQVKGEVRDSTAKEALGYATVVLQSPSDSAFRSAVTDQEGNFQLTKIPKGKYVLKVSFVGFKTWADTLDVQQNINLNTIFLEEAATSLDDLTIEGEAVELIVKEDTLEYNAEAFTVPEGSELEELLKKMPGVEVKDGTVTVNGKTVQKILVDGKPFFDNQMQTILKELPADFAKKIQFIEEKSEEAQFTGHDDGQRTQVMNVVSKPEKKKGYMGSLRATISPPGRYNFGGSVNFLKGDHRYSFNASWDNLNSGNSLEIPMSISGADVSRIMALQSAGSNGIGSNKSLGGSYYTDLNKKLEINTSLRWNNDESYRQTDISREYIQSSDEGRVYNEQSEGQRNNTRVSGSLSLVYKPSDKNQYTFRHTLTSASMLNTNSRSGETILNGNLLNSTNNRSYMENEQLGLTTQFAWRHKFAKEGRTLTIDFSNSTSNGTGSDSVKSTNIFTDGAIQEQIFDQISNPDDRLLTRNASISFSEKLGEKSSLSVRYQNELEEDKSEQLLYDFDNSTQSYSTLDPVRSSQYLLKNLENSLNLSYSLRLDKLRIYPRITYKNTRITNDQTFPREVDTDNNFTGLNTSITISRTSESGSQLQMNFGRTMTVPRAEQLQDVLDNSNPLFLRQGNPNLNSGFQNSLNLFFTKYNEEKERYTNVQLFANSSENATTNYTIVGNGSNSPDGIDLPVGVRYSRPVNISGAKMLNLNVSSSAKILKKKLTVQYGLSVDYSYSPQYLNEQIQYSETLGYSAHIGTRSDISEKLNLNLSIIPRYSTVSNSSPEDPGSNYFSWTSTFNGRWTIAEEFYVTSNLVYAYNGGVSSLGSFDRLIWTASLGKKILKKKLDLNILANDILKQASDQNRSVSAEYIENSSTVLLRQVFRISISYKFNKFG